MFPSVFVEVKLVIKRQVGVRRFAADMSSQHNVGGHARRMDKDTVVIVARSVSQPNIDGFVTAVFNQYTVDVDTSVSTQQSLPIALLTSRQLSTFVVVKTSGTGKNEEGQVVWGGTVVDGHVVGGQVVSEDDDAASYALPGGHVEVHSMVSAGVMSVRIRDA